jgi:proton glutamate symport protein
MSLTRRVLVALAAGLFAGLGISAAKDPRLFAAVSFLEPLGVLWVNAIRMTVIPLVVSLIIVGVASVADTAVVGRIGARTLLVFVTLLLASAAIACVLVTPIFSLLHIDQATSASLRAAASSSGAPAAEAAGHLPSFGQWLTELVPINPVKAAADGTMLPLVIFSIMFAIALIRTPPESRAPLVHFFKGVSGAMLILVRWIIALAPIGVFVLALGLASRLGATAAGAVGFYVLACCALALLELLLLYPVAVFFGKVPLAKFARAISPAQAVALSTRSSLASLPALIDGAERGLGLPRSISGFVLPLGVATFKISTPLSYVVSAVFIAHLYGIELASVQILTVAALGVLLSFSAPGIPSGGLILLTPVFAMIGLPAESIGILIALDVFPDVMRGITNVTADITVATILARKEPLTATPANL